MTKYFVAAASAIILLAANPPARSETLEIPSEKIFSSFAGEVIFHHRMHVKDLGIQCAECHHSINAKKLKTPHPEYFKTPSIKCESCHDESEKINQKAYTCSQCHRTNQKNIADETLSAKVVIHKQCWKCHPVGAGKDASAVCEKCHSGKKNFRQ
jgi:Zn finger protein HypA/HybF involved in hydrogenase expression